MGKDRLRCNLCGVPESQWVDNKCVACGNGKYCEMREEDIIDQRLYDWAVKQRILNCKGSVLYPTLFKHEVERLLDAGKKVPQYIIQFAKSI